MTEIYSGWGFCDGSNIFVNYEVNSSKYNYWKIEVIGKYSCFAYINKGGLVLNMGIGSATSLIYFVTKAATMISPFYLWKDVELKIIDKTGKIEKLDEAYVKKILQPYPDLYTSFNEKEAAIKRTNHKSSSADEDTDKENLMIEYIKKLNEAEEK